ncbi:heparan sulfate glucosamine 3-O-sulfotransferase 6-like [Apostichopus japonicus]|uniref:heparan sulfate glucosamine 3-O-sulfotransferase 6-like n=1 Tax=Stichopus japonicus TaxID=307972 RepID=UPI003AB4F9FB
MKRGRHFMYGLIFGLAIGLLISNIYIVSFSKNRTWSERLRSVFCCSSNNDDEESPTLAESNQLNVLANSSKENVKFRDKLLSKIINETNSSSHETKEGHSLELSRVKLLETRENCISPKNSKKAHTKTSKHRDRYLGQTPPLKDIDKILQYTFNRLPIDKARAFCEKLSRLEDERKLNFQDLSPRDKWPLAKNIFSSFGYTQKLPNLLGIGVKKSGTNAFEHFIKQHPLIKVPVDAKELHYFDQHYNRGIKYYKASLPICNATEISFEKTPKYFVTDTAPTNIAKDISPDTKFILCVRDPVERALSDWRHEKIVQLRKKRRYKCMGCTSKSEGVAFVQAVLTKTGSVDAKNVIVDTSNYARHFEKWLKVFSRDQFLIVKEEEISRTPFKVIREAEEFLDVPGFFREDMFVFENDKKRYCFKSTRREINSSCPPINSPSVPKPEISGEVVQKLRDFYRPHNRRFEELTGMNFSWSNL